MYLLVIVFHLFFQIQKEIHFFISFVSQFEMFVVVATIYYCHCYIAYLLLCIRSYEFNRYNSFEMNNRFLNILFITIFWLLLLSVRGRAQFNHLVSLIVVFFQLATCFIFYCCCLLCVFKLSIRSVVTFTACAFTLIDFTNFDRPPYGAQEEKKREKKCVSGKAT